MSIAEEKELREELNLLEECGEDLASLVLCRGADAMPLEMATIVARKVMLHLYRGSIECARMSLEEGWGSHIDDETLEDGEGLLREPLSRVLNKNDVRLLNLLEKAGIITVRDLIVSGPAEWLAIENVGQRAISKLSVLRATLKRRAGI